MKIYEVGGAVRDALLGIPLADRDWVVVGATPEEMISLGFKPVGRDFPVFLHPLTHEEYALARTERKTAPGYRGFVIHSSPSVSLEEDLARRDLTINAMARDEQGQLIDPFGGQPDLTARILRHVSPAFTEDPVRLLRVARFSARLAPFHFTVAAETVTLLRKMVTHGEIDALVPERVGQELERGLDCSTPSPQFAQLAEWGALPRLFPGIEPLWETNAFASARGIDMAASLGLPRASRWAVWLTLLAHNHPATLWRPLLDAWAEKLRWGHAQRQWLTLSLAHGAELRHLPEHGAELWLPLLERCDAWRRPTRFAEFLAVQWCVGTILEDVVPHLEQRGQEALKTCQTLDLHSLIQTVPSPRDIPQRVHAARLEALQNLDRSKTQG
ncbi:MAG: multifunctional CCA tRNA nucleotidyl transferase/2'3'-cyclic phosphodiesterase/2'nucleotidase/phosphatase [Ferrovum sp.]|nr:multifunctional CCA tRNA nucleotidyl transferase/2'3'-cyclic phosphodiesterase/2'nucleotidase/phosphatase [Ferrovum sp.]NDU87348.1 multifunctional CCA tRNA nucleotidyl transferase/2'3'-cyclic phosphodiesterase/2'nucleotidase/phosphatase [Ferrovum sp.]